jgi:hypothetical protein
LIILIFMSVYKKILSLKNIYIFFLWSVLIFELLLISSNFSFLNDFERFKNAVIFVLNISEDDFYGGFGLLVFFYIFLCYKGYASDPYTLAIKYLMSGIPKQNNRQFCLEFEGLYKIYFKFDSFKRKFCVERVSVMNKKQFMLVENNVDYLNKFNYIEVPQTCFNLYSLENGENLLLFKEICDRCMDLI